MTTIIQVLDPEWEGMYVKAHQDTPCGRGSTLLTRERDEALTFPDLSAALAFYRQQSKTVPLRMDGKPNRPLTAFTVEFQPSVPSVTDAHPDPAPPENKHIDKGVRNA